MQEVYGEYKRTILKDGSEGNYEVATDFFCVLEQMKKVRPAAFNRLAAAVHGLGDASELEGVANHYRPEIKSDFFELARLATVETPMSTLARKYGVPLSPRFTLASPFQKHAQGQPGIVDDKDRQTVVFDWAGPHYEICPIYRLRP
jgi:hypothetical protein